MTSGCIKKLCSIFFKKKMAKAGTNTGKTKLIEIYSNPQLRKMYAVHELMRS